MDFDKFKADYVCFEGRLNRWAYFTRLIIFGVCSSLFVWVCSLVLPVSFVNVIMSTVGLLNVGVNASLGVRRCHDLDKSGWWMLLGCIPVINFFFGIYLLFFAGTVGYNQYGPDPLD